MNQTAEISLPCNYTKGCSSEWLNLVKTAEYITLLRELLRRPKPIKPRRLPGRLRIDERRGTPTENVSGNRRPDWIRDVGRGFDDNGEISSPGDRKTELAGADAKIGIAD